MCCSYLRLLSHFRCHNSKPDKPFKQLISKNKAVCMAEGTTNSVDYCAQMFLIFTSDIFISTKIPLNFIPFLSLVVIFVLVFVLSTKVKKIFVIFDAVTIIVDKKHWYTVSLLPVCLIHMPAWVCHHTLSGIHFSACCCKRLRWPGYHNGLLMS